MYKTFSNDGFFPRECIIPDVSRTFHFAPGTHIYPEQQKKYFETRSFNIHREVKFENLSW